MLTVPIQVVPGKHYLNHLETKKKHNQLAAQNAKAHASSRRKAVSHIDLGFRQENLGRMRIVRNVKSIHKCDQKSESLYGEVIHGL